MSSFVPAVVSWQKKEKITVLINILVGKTPFLPVHSDLQLTGTIIPSKCYITTLV